MSGTERRKPEGGRVRELEGVERERARSVS